MAPRTFCHCHDSGSHSSKPNMPSSAPPHMMDPLHWHPNQHGRLQCSAVGSSWAANASESNCAHFLEARLDLFCAEDWPALWAMVRAECDVATASRSSRKSAAEEKQSGVRKAATLARSGERGRALAAARNAPPVPVTQQIVQEIKDLQPTDPDLKTLLRLPCRTSSCLKWPSWFQAHSDECRGSMNLVPSACALNIGMTSELETATCLCKLLHTSQLPLSRTQFCSTSENWTGHTARQTHKKHRPLLMIVLHPQTCSQVSHGSQEGIGGPMCWSSSIWRATTGRRQHHDQDHPTISC